MSKYFFTHALHWLRQHEQPDARRIAHAHTHIVDLVYTPCRRKLEVERALCVFVCSVCVRAHRTRKLQRAEPLEVNGLTTLWHAEPKDGRNDWSQKHRRQKKIVTQKKMRGGKVKWKK